MIQPNFIAAYIVDPQAKLVLLLKRAPSIFLGGIWQMVTGKVNTHHGESVVQNMRREVFEETGLKIDKAYNVNIVFFYEEILDQVGILANFLIFIDRAEKITLFPKEHVEYQWCSFEDATTKLAFSNQKETLAHIWQYFIKTKPSDLALIRL